MLGKAVERFGWILNAYVLMTNHFHLMVELTTTTLSAGMKWLNGTYAQNFNRRHGRVGHLFQGRFNARLIQKETYFLNVARYVVLNPVRAGLCKKPEQYRWSSYRPTAGLSKPAAWLAADDILRHFGDERAMAARRYEWFVHDVIGQNDSPWRNLVGQIYLGSDEWVDEMREKVALKPRDAEHPSVQRRVDRWTMNDVLTCVGAGLRIPPMLIRNSRGGTARMLAAWLGAHHALLPLATIGASLRIRSVGHVSELVKSCDGQLTSDDVLRDDLQRCRALFHVL